MDSAILKPANYTYWAQNQTYYNPYAPWYAPHLEIFRNASCFSGEAEIVIPATKYVLPYAYTSEQQIGVLNSQIPTINKNDSVWFVNPFNQTACFWNKGQQAKDVSCIGGSGCISRASQTYDRAIIVGTSDGLQALQVVRNSGSRLGMSTVATLASIVVIMLLIL